MTTRQTPSGDGSDIKTSVGLRNFQFTFNCSSMSCGSSRFIETEAMPGQIESSVSLSESVQTFPEEFGRTYHAYRAGSYAFPNDVPEQERLALQGEALKKLFDDRLFFAPLSQSTPPRTILDVATGVGDWAIQMGDLFPDSEVIATDLSPIQPKQVPPNVNFYVEDSSDPWEYSQRFDYIHTRATAGCWASFEKQVAEQALATLEPGGWFESQEMDSVVACDDGTLDPNGPMIRWFQELTMAGEGCDRSFVLGATLKDVYERVGFVDVQQRIFKIPINGWAKDERFKELGRMWEKNIATGLSGFSLRMFNRAYGRSPAEIEVSLVDVRQEISNPQIHAYMPIYVVWGRKPFAGEGPIPTPSF
ncbi:hypothetical protein G6O67_004364 [Ophiocordyceps sinensis]|uniref:Methyltransferase n=2 Tax=Ophiocordyceps sinensis TaxID=72228 RepID=A0A8H4M0H0_9HYPO|nr:hypothetical protein OCS_01902 [Ophiocordyceps sinensis CO18]KAF4507917.1 hypothetical protein G6O67_004364 [Ophiocordyceps sinensis]